MDKCIRVNPIQHCPFSTRTCFDPLLNPPKIPYIYHFKNQLHLHACRFFRIPPMATIQHDNICAFPFPCTPIHFIEFQSGSHLFR
ncbi:hypothetical protein Hanom_Chr15g01345741 [Helianthus anomalus]